MQHSILRIMLELLKVDIFIEVIVETNEMQAKNISTY